MRRGTKVAQIYAGLSVDGSGVNKEIVDSVDEAGDDIEDSGKDHGDRYGESFGEGFLSRMRGKFSDRFSSVMSGNEVAGDAGDKAGTTFVDRMSSKVSDLGDKIGAELSDRLASNPEQMRRGIDRAFDDDMLDRIGDRVGGRLAASISESIKEQSGLISAALDKAVSGNGKKSSAASDKGGLGAMVGRMLGAGSRNNALNLFGRAVGGTVTVVSTLTKAVSGMGSAFTTAYGNADKGSKIMAGLSASGSKLTAAFASLAISGPAVLAAIVAVSAALVILVSVMSALLAIVVALAATIASALVGALAVGAGAFGALAGAIGLVTMAFTSMTNAQRESFQTFEAIHAMAAGLGQIMIRDMIPAFETWSRNIQIAMALIKPLAEVMGGAFARAGTIMTAALSGPGIQQFITALSQTLPRIVTNLSRAFGGFLNGVSSVFAALMPFVLRFSGYLTRVATDFARWASSAKGQNSITDFVRRALDSLAALWEFVKAVGSLISDVFFSKSGQRSGNSIFENMAGAVRRFARYLAEENRLENWFKTGQKFAKSLGKAIEGVAKILEDLNNSKVIDAIGLIATIGETAYTWWNKLPGAIQASVGPLGALTGPLYVLQDAYEKLIGLMGDAHQIAATPMADMLTDTSVFFGGGEVYGPAIPPGAIKNKDPMAGINKTIDDLIASGTKALDTTYEMNGGHMPDPVESSGAGSGAKKPQYQLGKLEEWVNIYVDWANALVSKSARVADEIRAAAKEARAVIAAALDDVLDGFRDLMIDFNDSFADVVANATTSTDTTAVVDSFRSMIETAADGVAAAVTAAYDTANSTIAAAQASGDQMIANAQAAVDSAASAVASASTPAELKAALKVLDKARQDLELAREKAGDLLQNARAAADQMILAADASADGVNRANNILAGQAVLTWANVDGLVAGLKVEGATLTDFAEARRQVAEKLVAATQQLVDAISLRDNYAGSVADSIRTFGSLLSAQAKTLNGVEQALTATDITDSMQERLDKIRKFRSTLQQLLGLGLSDAAYKQIVDAGVDNGGAYADAILAGGQGAVSEVNNLTDQIDIEGLGIGGEAANAMYQAGVDAAQGLVDGLTSLSGELDSAAAQLGASIAAAIKRELGIASPSRVLMALMDNVGDGAVVGLDNQHSKVGAAGARLAAQVAVSPEVAAYAGRQAAVAAGVEDGVSGNSAKWLWTGDIVTPTEDPEAVVNEVLNEITARL